MKESREHFRQAEAYAAEERYPEAALEYRTAISRDPGFARAYYRLGEVYSLTAEPAKALGAYVRAADIDGSLTEAQLRAAGLLLIAGMFEDARMRARAVLESEPRNTDALLILGNALAGMNSLDEAVAANQRALELDPTRPDVYVNLGSLEMLRGDAKEAEQRFREAVTIDPTSVETRIGLASFLWLSGRTEEAEDEFKRAHALAEADPEADTALASFYIRTDRPLAAEPHLRSIADRTGSVGARLALADYYFMTGRHEEALDQLDRLRQERPDDVAILIKMARVHHGAGRPQEALHVLERVLAEDPREVSALSLKAHLLVESGRRAEALTTARAAVASGPHLAAGHYALGVISRQSGNLDEAQQAFSTVLRIDFAAAGAMIELAQIHLARRQVDTALEYAERAIKVSPGDLETHLTLVRVLSARPEDYLRAEAILTRLLDREPRHPGLHLEAGRLSVLQGRLSEGRTALVRAAALAPSSIEPAMQLARLEARAGRLAEARRIVDAAIPREPRSIPLRLMAAQLHMTGDMRQAEPHLRAVLELDPQHIDAYQMLGTIYMRRGDLSAARVEFGMLAERQPTLVEPPTMAGILAGLEGDEAEAERWYQRALTIDARAAAAANNLAWIYAERGANLEAALQLALTAERELPGRPDVLDTLGWVYYKRGQLDMAVRTFQDCVQREPGNPVFHYHLGLAHAKNLQDARARVALTKALDINPKFMYAEDARRALRALLY